MNRGNTGMAMVRCGWGCCSHWCGHMRSQARMKTIIYQALIFCSFLVLSAAVGNVTEEMLDNCQDVEPYINTTNLQFTALFCPNPEKDSLHKHIYECFDEVFIGCKRDRKILACKYNGEHAGGVTMFCVDPSQVVTKESPSKTFAGYGTPPTERELTDWVGFGTLVAAMIAGASVLIYSCATNDFLLG